MGLGIPEMMAIGGGVGLLTGGLRGGLQGAALGGIGGGLSNYVKGGSFLQNAAAKPIASVAAGEAPFAGAVFNPSTGTWLNPEFYAGASTPFATYTGGQGLLANATGNLLDTLPDYVTPKNVLGAASIISNMQQPQYQMPAAQGGGVRQGSTQGLNVNYGMAQPIKRRGYA
jgi:hypothetical protein